IIKARAVIIPSIWYENMPLSMLEALNLGTPVIASEIGGMPEIVKTGYNGLLFKPGDKEDLVKKINSINSYDLKRLSQQARSSTKDLTTKNNLSKVVEIYKEILDSK
ncbi:MAG: glycosyltransferase, partial [Candidatus Pacebacteria bacterium]|nr:glycosyltransferase [Candidatus Paceibacterota bacterium]